MIYCETKRGACCSCCNKGIEKNEEKAINFQGMRSGQHKIFICTDCVEQMSILIETDEKVLDKQN